MRLFCLRKPEGCGREDMRDRHCIWRNPGHASRQFANGSARGFPGIFSISATFTIGDCALPTICWARAPPREVERHGRLWAKNLISPAVPVSSRGRIAMKSSASAAWVTGRSMSQSWGNSPTSSQRLCIVWTWCVYTLLCYVLVCMLSLKSAYATHITTPDSGIDHARKQGFELKMPDDKYKDIPPNQTGFSKAAVDRFVRSCVCV
jgi:hypothetical protein